MKVDSPRNMDQVAGTCCRQAPVRGLIGNLVFCAILIGLVFLLWQQGFPWFAWGGFAVLAALLVPWLLYDALAKFRSTNWLLRFGPDGLWIKLSEAELDELVAQLVRSGDDLEASQLLIRRRGCSATEAHKFVEEQARRI